MSQQSVYNYLKKNKERWFTAVELSKIIKIKKGNVTNNLKRLEKGKYVFRKVDNSHYRRFLWKFRQ